MPRSYATGEFAEELGVHPEPVNRWWRNDDEDDRSPDRPGAINQLR
jgi:hypothetical protein